MSVRTCNAISGGGEERSRTRAPPSHPLFPVALGPAYVWWLKEVGGAQGESSTGAQRRWGVSRPSWVFQRGAPSRVASNLNNKGRSWHSLKSAIDFDCTRKFHLPRPVSTGWRARLFLPPAHPPVADEVLHQRTSMRYGLGHVQLTVAADACPLEHAMRY